MNLDRKILRSSVIVFAVCSLSLAPYVEDKPVGESLGDNSDISIPSADSVDEINKILNDWEIEREAWVYADCKLVFRKCI